MVANVLHTQHNTGQGLVGARVVPVVPGGYFARLGGRTGQIANSGMGRRQYKGLSSTDQFTSARSWVWDWLIGKTEHT